MIWTDVFNSKPFNVIDLTTFVNKQEPVPQVLQSLLGFERYGSLTPTISIERRTVSDTLIGFSERGANPSTHDVDKRDALKLDAPCIKVWHHLWADEVMNVRAPGELRVWALREIVDDVLMQMRARLDRTLEFHRGMAAQGLVKDPITDTTRYNIVTEHGLGANAEIALDLDAASPATGALTKKLAETLQTMRNKSGDIDLTGRVLGLCSDTAWNSLVTHKEVLASYSFDVNGSDFLRERIADGAFTWRGIRWVNQGRAMGGKLLVPADKILFVPFGVPGLWREDYAPADFFTDDGSGEVRGQPLYVPPLTPDPMNPNAPRFVRLELQSNPIFHCVRPELLFIARKGS